MGDFEASQIERVNSQLHGDGHPAPPVLLRQAVDLSDRNRSCLDARGRPGFGGTGGEANGQQHYHRANRRDLGRSFHSPREGAEQHHRPRRHGHRDEGIGRQQVAMEIDHRLHRQSDEEQREREGHPTSPIAQEQYRSEHGEDQQDTPVLEVEPRLDECVREAGLDGVKRTVAPDAVVLGDHPQAPKEVRHVEQRVGHRDDEGERGQGQRGDPPEWPDRAGILSMSPVEREERRDPDDPRVVLGRRGEPAEDQRQVQTVRVSPAGEANRGEHGGQGQETHRHIGGDIGRVLDV